MFYKNWPYWLKGGIISIITMVILMGLAYWLPVWFSINIDISFLLAFLVFAPTAILASLVGLGGCFNMDGPCSLGGGDSAFIIMIILNMAGYFIVGAIIGLIYGKIKRRIKNKKNVN